MIHIWNPTDDMTHTILFVKNLITLIAIEFIYLWTQFIWRFLQNIVLYIIILINITCIIYKCYFPETILYHYLKSYIEIYVTP